MSDYLGERNIVIQRIGYESSQFEVKINSIRGLIIPLLPVDHNLEEVMVNTGYQTLPKERATGSFEVISNDVLGRQVSTDIISRLKGSSSILFDGESGRPPLTIRGLSSIYGDKDPLIVLNNFPYEGNINNINPNDVESITILKDAAAASIWGTRASNGVIVITTKSASFEQPLNISLVTNFKITDQPNFEYVRQISSSDFIDVEQFLFEHGYKLGDTASLARPAFTPAYEVLFKERNGQISHAEAQSLLRELGQHSVLEDFNKYVYQRDMLQQYAVNIDGGTRKNAFHISAGFDKEITNLSGKSDRVTLHIEDRVLPISELEITTSLNYNRSDSKSGKPSYNNLKSHLYPYAKLATSNGISLPISRGYRKSFIDTVGGGKLLDWHYYPLEDYKHTNSRGISEDILGNFNLKYKPISVLNLILQYQYERQQSTSESISDVESYYARDLINKFSQIDNSTGLVRYIVPMGGILDQSRLVMESHSLRGQIDYHQVFGDHDITVLIGSELRSATNKSNSNKRFGYDDNLLTFGEVDLVNSYPTIVPGNNQFIQGGGNLDESTNRFVSVFANGAYTFKDRYIISGSARRDASNLFGVNTNDKWSPLWSTGASWIISKESFWNNDILQYLKFRTTYGFSGNVDQSRSAVTTLRYSRNAQYTNYPAASVHQFANPDLRWEKTGMLNLGIDFSVKNFSLDGSIEYYRKKGVDLFGYAPVDWTAAGTSSMRLNVANMEGRGWDIHISSTPVNREIKWEFSTNISFSNSMVSKYYSPSDVASAFVDNGYSINPLVGYPVYGIVSYRWAGLDPKTGDPMGVIDGQKTKEYIDIFNQNLTTLQFSGSSTPTSYGSLYNSISFRNFTLSANILFKFGYYYRRPSIDYGALFSNYFGDIDYEKRWINPGDEMTTYVPSMVYPSNSNRNNFYLKSDILSEKADNIRLQFVSVNYQLNNRSMKKLPFKALSVSAILNNLGILWRASKINIDPDHPNSLAPLRSFSIGIKANF